MTFFLIRPEWDRHGYSTVEGVKLRSVLDYVKRSLSHASITCVGYKNATRIRDESSIRVCVRPRANDV